MVGSISDMHTSEETLDVKTFSKEQVKDMELAFDHKKMLKDSDFI